ADTTPAHARLGIATGERPTRECPSSLLDPVGRCACPVRGGHQQVVNASPLIELVLENVNGDGNRKSLCARCGNPRRLLGILQVEIAARIGQRIIATTGKTPFAFTRINGFWS